MPVLAEGLVCLLFQATQPPLLVEHPGKGDPGFEAKNEDVAFVSEDLSDHDDRAAGDVDADGVDRTRLELEGAGGVCGWSDAIEPQSMFGKLDGLKPLAADLGNRAVPFRILKTIEIAAIGVSRTHTSAQSGSGTEKGNRVMIAPSVSGAGSVKRVRLLSVKTCRFMPENRWRLVASGPLGAIQPHRMIYT